VNTLQVHPAVITLDDGLASDFEAPEPSTLSAERTMDKVFVRADAPLLIWVFR